MAASASADSAPLGKRITAALVERMIVRDLRRTFRRIVWVGPEPWSGPEPVVAPDRPLVLYSNHHSFYDGYLLWLLARHLGRPPLLWMNEWDRIPIFGPLGALPFPPDDTPVSAPASAAQRLATIRETTRRLRNRPESVFLYFPEGELRSPDEGVAPFPPDRAIRLARLLPERTQWWPVGVHVTWWGEDRPTVLLGGGPPHDAPDGDERDRLVRTLDRLRTHHSGGRTLLDGRPSVHERWDLSVLAPLLLRWT